jgi:hypothetical protein
VDGDLFARRSKKGADSKKASAGIRGAASRVRIGEVRRALCARDTTAGFAAMGPVGKELVMKKIMSLILVAALSLALAAPVYAGRAHGGGFHGGSSGGFHHGFHHGGFHRGCCFGPAFVGGVFVGSALAYP